MMILALDSTMNGCSVCVYDKEKGVLADEMLEMSRGQAEHLMPMIETVINAANITYDSLDMIAVTKGPGAFTGMRIGLATAKALGLALNIPVRGICTFQAIVRTYLDKEDIKRYPYYGVLLETKRQDYYFRMFDGKTLSPVSEKIAAPAQDIITEIDNRSCLLLGDANQRFQKDLPDNHPLAFSDISLPSSAVVARLSLETEEQDCAPVYLRPPDVSMPKTLPRRLKKISAQST